MSAEVVVAIAASTLQAGSDEEHSVHAPVAVTGTSPRRSVPVSERPL